MTVGNPPVTSPVSEGQVHETVSPILEITGGASMRRAVGLRERYIYEGHLTGSLSLQDCKSGRLGEAGVPSRTSNKSQAEYPVGTTTLFVHRCQWVSLAGPLCRGGGLAS